MSGEQPASTGPRTKLIVLAVVGVLVVAAAVVGVIAWTRDDSGPTAKAGEYFHDLVDSEELHLDTATVQLPWGTLSIAATKAMKRMPGTAISEAHDTPYDKIAAPGGGSFVGITLDADAQLDAGRSLIRASDKTAAPPTRISILSGDNAYPFGATSGTRGGPVNRIAVALGQSGEGFLALPTRPDHVTIAVEYGGVTQRVVVDSGKRTTGKAAPLYADQPLFARHACGPVSWPAAYRASSTNATCVVTRFHTVPYVAGLGWAKTGRTWLVTTIHTYPPSYLVHTSPSGRVTRYHPLGAQLATNLTGTFAGQRPAVSADFNDVETGFTADPDHPWLLVFGVATGDAGVHGELVIHAAIPAGEKILPSGVRNPSSLTVTATWRVTPR